MFGDQYTNSPWRDSVTNNATPILIFLITLTVVLFFLNLLPSFHFSLPKIFKDETVGTEKIITNTKTFKEIPIHRLVEIEKQL